MNSLALSVYLGQLDKIKYFISIKQSINDRSAVSCLLNNKNKKIS